MAALLHAVTWAQQAAQQAQQYDELQLVRRVGGVTEPKRLAGGLAVSQKGLGWEGVQAGADSQTSAQVIVLIGPGCGFV